MRIFGPLTAGAIQLLLCQILFKLLSGPQSQNYMTELKRVPLNVESHPPLSQRLGRQCGVDSSYGCRQHLIRFDFDRCAAKSSGVGFLASAGAAGAETVQIGFR